MRYDRPDSTLATSSPGPSSAPFRRVKRAEAARVVAALDAVREAVPSARAMRGQNTPTGPARAAAPRVRYNAGARQTR